MKQINKTFDAIRFYGIFGLLVVMVVFYMIFWGKM